MKKQNLIISIDFDGTICELSFPEVGKQKDWADVYINKLYDEGHYIIINTCRSGIYEGLAETFLKERGIKYHYINCNMPYLIKEYKQDCRKISADIYIDDKCLMGLPDSWEEIYNIIQKKKGGNFKMKDYLVIVESRTSPLPLFTERLIKVSENYAKGVVKGLELALSHNKINLENI